MVFTSKTETLKVKSKITGKEIRAVVNYIHCSCCNVDFEKHGLEQHRDTRKHIKNMKEQTLKSQLFDILDYVEMVDDIVCGLVSDELREYLTDKLS